MSKMKLSWHKECLINMERSYSRQKEHISRLQEDLERSRKAITQLDSQIIEAELRGVDGFDSDKFGIKRK